MKPAIYLIALSFLLAANACRRNDTKPAPVTPKEQLPPYTETGANTFGCLIDGEVFVPGKPAFSLYNILDCGYQYVNDTMYFVLAGSNFNTKKVIAFNFQRLYIYEGNYPLGYFYLNDSTAGRYRDIDKQNEYCTMPPIVGGELTIKHFDSINQIVSGTFWFDAIDTATDKIVHVTDGRFDVSYYK